MGSLDLAKAHPLQRADQSGIGAVVLVTLYADQMPLGPYQRRKLLRVLAMPPDLLLHRQCGPP